MAATVDERRHLAILNGTQRFDVALSPRATIADTLVSLGVEWDADRWALLGADGRPVETETAGEQIADGTVMVLVDLTVPTPGRATRSMHGSGAAAISPTLGWILTAFGLVLASLSLLDPQAIDTSLRIGLASVTAVGALSAVLISASPSRAGDSAAPVLGGLVLAFASGVIAVPALPAATGETSVFVGFVFAGVLAAALTALTPRAQGRAQAGLAAVLLVALAAVWGAAILLNLPASAPSAIALGAVPVALRALPAVLIDVPPGMFIDFPRFQSLRWSVRERVPEPIMTVSAEHVDALVARSSTRLTTGTVLISLTAACAAPWAFGMFSSGDPIVFVGQVALACSVTIALLLGARRSSDGLLRWMPRAVAVVLVGTALVATARIAELPALTIAACAALAGGLAAAFIVVPIARGASSLFGSRLADVIENLAVVLAFPAGLLAAGAIEVLRGVMAT